MTGNATSQCSPSSFRLGPLGETLRPIALDLYGPGRIGQALVGLLRERRIAPRRIYNRHGLVTGDPESGPAKLLVDCTTPYYEGEPAQDWTDTLVVHLENGVHLITCNKAPLATAWQQLQRAAKQGDARIFASATVGGGTPVLSVLDRLERTLGVAKIEACASGTLGHVFDQVAGGTGLAQAVGSAQEQGYAEPDPKLDLDGTDLAAKAVILHNHLQDAPVRHLDPAEAPFLVIDTQEIHRLAQASGVPRAVATIERDTIELQVQDAPWAAGAALDAVVRVTTRDGSVFLLRGPGAGVTVTAGNLLADLDTLEEVTPRNVLD